MPVVRKGQHKPYFKGTRKQIEQRIEAAGLLSSCGFKKTQIHRVFRERYKVEWRQTDRYMALARARSKNHSLSPDSAPLSDPANDATS